MSFANTWRAWCRKSQKRHRRFTANLGSGVVESLEIRLLPAATTLGDVFKVPSRTIGEQVYDSIATDPSGNFTVVFADNGLDSSGWGIYARRFAASGTPLGAQFRINSSVDNDQYYPSIATNRVGKSLVVWRNQRFAGGYTRPISLDYQFLNADGTLLGDNRNLIPEYDYSEGSGVFLAGATWDYSPRPWTFTDSADQFWVVVPVTDNQSNKGFHFWKADTDGTLKDAFQTQLINEGGEESTYILGSLSVEFGADGTFYVPYNVDRNKAIPDVGQKYTSQLIVQRLSSRTGQPIGADIVVHEAIYYDNDSIVEHRQPLVVPQSDGRFSVLYYNRIGDLVAQHYSADGSRQGSLIKFIDHAELTPDFALSPVAVSVLSNGHWLVVWNTNVAFQNDASFAREFQTDGRGVGPAVKLGAAYFQGALHIAPLPNNQFVASWQDGGGNAGYGDVYARRIEVGAVVASRLVIIQQPTSGTVGVPLGQAVKIAFEDESGQVLKGDASTVILTVNTGPGDFANGSAFSMAAVNGVATFNNLIFDTAGSYTLTASGGSLTAALSAAINVMSAPMTNKLVIVQQPGLGTVGVPLGLAGPARTLRYPGGLGKVAPWGCSV